MTNLFELPLLLSDEEFFEPLLSRKGLLIERIISTGQITPLGQWYNQTQEEWVIVLQGEAQLSYEDGSTVWLKVGDYLLIPAYKRHRVDYTSSDPPCIWLAVHFEG